MPISKSSAILCVFLGVSSFDAALATEQIREVTAAEWRTLDAGSGEWVRVTGTVCYQDPLWKFLFLVDDRHGIFSDPVRGTYKIGDRLQIAGPVGNGHGAPIFSESISITKVGVSELPPPAKIDLADWDWDKVLSDPRNSTWVELDCHVEQVVLIDKSTRLWCRCKDRLFAVTVAEASNLRDAWELVGADIRVRGALGILLNRQNRIHGPLLLTQKWSFIEVLSAPEERSFPEFDNQRVRYFKVDDGGSFRTSGQVTLAAEKGLFIDDGFAAAKVFVASSFDTPVDAFVEVLGTTNADRQLHARVLTLRNQSLEIWPVDVAVQHLTEEHVGRRIRIRATATTYDVDTTSLRVRDGASYAEIMLPKVSGKEVKHMRHRGSRGGSLDLATAKQVDIFGVLESIDDGVPVIRAVSRDDVIVLSRRWALTPTNLLRMVGTLAASLIAIGLLVIFLRRQVGARTRELSDLTAQLRASYDAVDAGVVAVSTNGTLLTVNETANKLLATSLVPGDTATKFIASLAELADDPSPIYEMVSAFRREHTEPFVLEVPLAQGERKVRLTLATINRDKKHIGNLWVMHDETQLQRLQTELFQAQKMDAIGTLAGGIAHDFNNLLTAVIGNLDLLRMSSSEELERTCIDEAEAACMSAGELVQQLLGLSRKRQTQRKVVQPQTIVDNVKSLVKHGFDSRINIEFFVEAEAPPFYVDQTQIEQVLLNLCVNARDAMPNGGQIAVECRPGKLRGEPAVVMSVSDTGSGIPEHLKGRIFEPFFTTKDVGEGTGLGLATAFNILNRHEGEMRCDSKLGEGSKFTVLLPAASETEVVRQELLPQLDSLRGNETILVVDDEWVVRIVASRLLLAGGYQTMEAEDGLSCLEVLERYHSAIDMVLLDVTMPGMSGHKVLREIRRRYPNMPVLMCSGYDLTSGADGNFENFVPKPFSASTLFQAVRMMLDRPESASMAVV